MCLAYVIFLIFDDFCFKIGKKIAKTSSVFQNYVLIMIFSKFEHKSADISK